MLFYSVIACQECPEISEIVVVVSRRSLGLVEQMPWRERVTKVVKEVQGGPRRQDSVFNGLRALNPDSQIVAVHDAARPLVQPEWFSSAIKALGDLAGVVYAVPVTDTIKRASSAGIVQETVSRDGLFVVQTPQVFKTAWLLEAHRLARDRGEVATDDAALVEACGGKIKLLAGFRSNIKVTFEEDRQLAESLLRQR